MLAETPVAQRSPCYSAVTSSLTNPLSDCSNYSPFCHTHYLTPDQYFTSLFRPDPLPTALPRIIILHCCSALLQNLVGNSGEMRTLNNKQRQVLMFLILLFKLLTQFFFLFSLSLSSLCSFSQSSLLSLSTISFFSSDCPPMVKTSSFITVCFTNGTYFAFCFTT